MLRDYIVIENALDDPLLVRNKILSIPFYTREDFELPRLTLATDTHNTPIGGWRGFRTCNLVQYYPDFCKSFIPNLVDKVFDFDFRYDISLFGHIATSKMVKETEMHVDDCEVLAGVVYLNQDPIPGSGTWLKLNNKLIHIENKFNRLILYKSNISHRPGLFFGTTAQDSRLTLTVFINKISFNPVPIKYEKNKNSF